MYKSEIQMGPKWQNVVRISFWSPENSRSWVDIMMENGGTLGMLMKGNVCALQSKEQEAGSTYMIFT